MSHRSGPNPRIPLNVSLACGWCYRYEAPIGNCRSAPDNLVPSNRYVRHQEIGSDDHHLRTVVSATAGDQRHGRCFSITTPSAYPVSSATILACRGRTSQGGSSSSSAGLRMRRLVATIYLRARWPDGFRCPACGFDHAYELPRRFLWQCSRCHHQVSYRRDRPSQDEDADPSMVLGRLPDEHRDAGRLSSCSASSG